MPGPLDGIRIIDLTSMISGPVATMLLGDQGADVIKVEPLTGDLVRYMGPNRDGLTSGFISANRSKRSIAVDLKTAEGMQVVDVSLTKEQYISIQHMLPKRYALIEHRHIKKGGVVTSALKLTHEDVLTTSLRRRTCREYRATLTMHRGGPSASGSKKLISSWRSRTG